jgi:hypothetical protein
MSVGKTDDHHAEGECRMVLIVRRLNQSSYTMCEPRLRVFRLGKQGK